MIKQLHLFRRGVDLFPVNNQFIRIQIDDQLVKGQLFIDGADMIRPAHHRMHAGEKLFDLKGLGDIIIRPHLEAGHLVVGLALRRQHDDRRGGLLADGPADLPAVLSGQHDVQQNHIGLEQIKISLRLVAVRGNHDIEAVLCQVQAKKLGNIRVVLNN